MRRQSALAEPPVGRKWNRSAELLLDAMASLLCERSAMEVSLHDVAKRSQLNSALVKYYFGNKDGLLLAVLEREAERDMAALDHLVQMSVSAEQKLKIHINGIINAFHRSPYLNRLIHSMIEYGDEKARKRVGEIYVEPMLAAYDAIIAQGVREGAFRSIDSQFLYYSLVGACEKIFNAKTDVTSNLPGPERIGDKTKDEYVAYVTRLFLHGLLSTSASR